MKTQHVLGQTVESTVEAQGSYRFPETGVRTSSLANLWPLLHLFLLHFRLELASFLDSFVKLIKSTISFAVFVCPHGTTPLPLEEFP